MKKIFSVLNIVFSIVIFVGLICLINHIANNIRKTTAEKEAIADSIRTDSIKADSIVEATRFNDYIAKVKSKIRLASVQIKGIDLYTTITNNDEFSVAINQTEKWFLIDMYDWTAYYVMWFEKSPLGVKHALSKIIELCKINGKDFNTPDLEDSVLKVWYIEGYRFSFSSDSKISWVIEGYPDSFSTDSKIYSIMLSYDEISNHR